MLTHHARQTLNPPLTPWHITFGTYGTRLHGDERPTADSHHNRLDTPLLPCDPDRQEFERSRMRFPPRYFTVEQRSFVESELPTICVRGGWSYRICAAAPDHVHLLCDVHTDIHGERVRRLVKRWLEQKLSQRWPLPKDATWWAEEGSNIALDNEQYLHNCFKYILKQRTTPFGAEDGTAGSQQLPQKRAGAYPPPLIYRFQVNLFAAPERPYAVTWEEAAAALDRLPRMIFELDGSFIFSGDDEVGNRWQVDGHLFDFGGHLHRVELHGQCPATAFDNLLRTVGWPEQPLVFEMVREGTTLTEQEFRKCAAYPGTRPSFSDGAGFPVR